MIIVLDIVYCVLIFSPKVSKVICIRHKVQRALFSLDPQKIVGLNLWTPKGVLWKGTNLFGIPLCRRLARNAMSSFWRAVLSLLSDWNFWTTKTPAVAVSLLELGSYIIPPGWARGDYGWIGQAAREICVLLGYTPGTRQLKKTMEQILNSTQDCHLCSSFVWTSYSTLWVFRKYKVKEHPAGSVVVTGREIQLSLFRECMVAHLVFFFRCPRMFDNFLEILQR